MRNLRRGPAQPGKAEVCTQAGRGKCGCLLLHKSHTQFQLIIPHLPIQRVEQRAQGQRTVALEVLRIVFLQQGLVRAPDFGQKRLIGAKWGSYPAQRFAEHHPYTLVDQDGEAGTKEPGDIEGKVYATIPADDLELTLDTVLE